jgi:hypothetical protein
MTLPSKLAANLNAVLVTPTSWTMNNGVVRFGNKIPNTSLGMVQISTAANGKIDAWTIGGQSSIPGDLYNEFFTVTQSNGADYGLEVLPAGLYAEGANTPGNGTWTQP